MVIHTGELGYDGPLYDGFLHMTDDMLGPSPMHIKYSSYVYDGFCIWRTNFPGPIESVISKFTCITILNIFRHGVVAPVPPVGRCSIFLLKLIWLNKDFDIITPYYIATLNSGVIGKPECRWRYLPPGGTAATPPYLKMFSLVICTKSAWQLIIYLERAHSNDSFMHGMRQMVTSVIN